MSTPFTLQSILTFPPDDGEADADRSATVQSQYDHEVCLKLKLTGGGTKVVDFGSIDTDGAKAVQVEVDAVSLAAVMLQFNGGGVSGQLEVSPGGHMDLGSPSPSSNGVLQLSVVHTQDATVRVRILG